MADFRHPGRVAMEEVAAALEAASIGLPATSHDWGAKGRSKHARPPHYTWVFIQLRDKNDTPSRVAEHVRTLFATRCVLSIDCWGVDDDHTWAMANNLMKALHDCGYADVDLEGAEAVRPGEAHNQAGEMLRVQVAIDVPFIDAFVDVTPPTMLEPEASTFIPPRWEGGIYLSPTTETDGEKLTDVTS